MPGLIRIPVQADIGSVHIVLDEHGFRHLGRLVAFDGRGRLIMRSTAVQIGLTSRGRTWDHSERLETIEGARIVEE